MSKVVLNGVEGMIVEDRISLPNIGLGPSTATIGAHFEADPAQTAKPVLRFEAAGEIRMGGAIKKCYKVFEQMGGSFVLIRTIYVPRRTPKKDLPSFLGEQYE